MARQSHRAKTTFGLVDVRGREQLVKPAGNERGMNFNQ
jgi:hypothetical protein